MHNQNKFSFEAYANPPYGYFKTTPIQIIDKLSLEHVPLNHKVRYFYIHEALKLINFLSNT
jgi:hypothetical protein